MDTRNKPGSWFTRGFERRGELRRDLAALLAAIVIYALPIVGQAVPRLLGAEQGATLPRLPLPGGVLERVLEHADGRAHARYASALQKAVERGELTHGAALIRLNRLDALSSHRALDAAAAERAYAAVLDEARRLVAYGERLAPAIARAAEGAGYQRYKRIHHGLGDALLNSGGSCQAQTQLVVSLMVDLGRGHQAFLRVFDNHVAPAIVEDSREHNFGMLAGCHGSGVLLESSELIALHDPAPRSPEARGYFDWPVSHDTCDDTLDDFGERALSSVDPPRRVPARRSGSMGAAVLELAPGYCGEPIPPWRSADRITIAVDGAAEASAATYFDIEDYQVRHRGARAVCQRQLVDDLAKQGAPALERLIETSKLVGLLEDASVSFAAAGHFDLAREYQRRRTLAWREGHALLKKIDPKSSEAGLSPTAMSFASGWSLVLLGAGGHAMIERLAEHFPSLLVVLLADPATRTRAIELAERQSPLNQGRILNELSGELSSADLGPSPLGRRWVAAKAAARSIAGRWQSCRFDDLLAITKDEARKNGLERSWVGVLFGAGFTSLYGTVCGPQRMDEFVRDYRRWEANLDPGELRALGFAP